MSRSWREHTSRGGFTLVELMVALFLASIAVVGIYRAYVSFTAGADAQEQIIEMQQSLRVGMNRLVRDLRRAAMDEEDDDIAGFELADAAEVTFTLDLGGTDPGTAGEDTDPAQDTDGDGDVADKGERFTYSGTDFDGDGVDDLVRDDVNGDGPAVVMTNLEALDFVYLDEDGNALAPRPLSAANRALIRAVQVTMVVRTTNEDYRYTHDITHTNMQGDTVLAAQGDNFRRRTLSRQVKIRNMGL